jgi:hypothetical protein
LGAAGLNFMSFSRLSYLLIFIAWGLSELRKKTVLRRDAPNQYPVDSVHPQQHSRASGNAGDYEPSDLQIVSSSASPQADEADNQTYRRRQEHRDRWKLGVEILTFLVVLAYTIVACNQWQQMIVSNKQTRQIFETTERAHVTLGAQSGKLAEDRNGVIVLHFYNAGRTPAKDFGVSAWSNLLPNAGNSISRLRRYKGTGEGSLRIKVGHSWGAIPGSSSHIEYFANEHSPSKEQLVQIQAGKLPFFIFGFYAYCDQFGRYHSENFRIQYRAAPVRDFVAMPSSQSNVSQMSEPAGEGDLKAPGQTLIPLPRCRQPDEE